MPKTNSGYDYIQESCFPRQQFREKGVHFQDVYGWGKDHI
jgi:hypothetical protein